MEFTPKQIVGELDRYIIGQDEAKKADCPKNFAKK